MGGKGRTGKEGEVEGGAGMRRGGEGREGRGMGRGRNGPPLFGSRPCRRTVDTLSAESGVPGHIPPGQFLLHGVGHSLPPSPSADLQYKAIWR